MKHKIVLVPFPFDNLSGSKLRPALCLTTTIGTYDHVVVAFITSQLAKADEPSDVAILSNSPDFVVTGLKVDSAIRLHRIITLPLSLIQRQLGTLPNALQDIVSQKLRTLFDV